jgi:SAM-dependent methyltransferase
MSVTLPPPARIAGHYDTLMRDIAGDYIRHRWGGSETQRRHYAQTETALRAALDERGEPGAVLEIGCGPAVWTPLYLPHARSVTLFDISEEMLRGARARVEGVDGGRHAQRVRYLCGDFVASAPEDASYDTVVSARAFEYMSDKAAFVRRCRERLRPGGRVVLVTKNAGWRDLRGVAASAADVPVGLAMQADLKGWREVVALFQAAGFAEVAARPVVFGSYRHPFRGRAGLAAADALHRAFHRRPMAAWMDPIVESYAVTCRAPA